MCEPRLANAKSTQNEQILLVLAESSVASPQSVSVRRRPGLLEIVVHLAPESFVLLEGYSSGQSRIRKSRVPTLCP